MKRNIKYKNLIFILFLTSLSNFACENNAKKLNPLGDAKFKISSEGTNNDGALVNFHNSGSIQLNGCLAITAQAERNNGQGNAEGTDTVMINCSPLTSQKFTIEWNTRRGDVTDVTGGLDVRLVASVPDSCAQVP